MDYLLTSFKFTCVRALRLLISIPRRLCNIMKSSGIGSQCCPASALANLSLFQYPHSLEPIVIICVQSHFVAHLVRSEISLRRMSLNLTDYLYSF